MRDKYNLNTLPYAQEHDDIATSGFEGSGGNNMYMASGGNVGPSVRQPNQPPIIPGMAPEDRVPSAEDHQKLPPHLQGFNFGSNIPGLDRLAGHMDEPSKKVPYAKPIPKNFQNSWNHDLGPPGGVGPQMNPINNMALHQGGPFPQGGPPIGPPPGHPMGGVPSHIHPNNNNGNEMMEQNDFMSLQELQRQATAVVAFGNVYPVLPGSNLYVSIISGEMTVKDILRSEFLSS